MCNDAPCHRGCPATVSPRKFLRLIRFGDMTGAVRHLREANILAASVAYICPCLTTCASECTNEKLSHPIDISGLQRFAMDWERKNGMIEPQKAPRNGKKVAVVGSGPAGLSCAARLAAKGYDVEVFEREKELGGQLRLTIPSFRLPPEVIDFEIEFIKKLGVKFHLRSEILNLKLLRDKFDAVFVAAGLMRSKMQGLPGEDKKGVFAGLDFLTRAKRGEKMNVGARTLVVGGGDVAMDVARVAKRLGSQVLVLYRRTQKEMSAYVEEVDAAFNEGVEFWFRVIPIEVAGAGKVEGLKVRRVQWKETGRLANEYEVEGEPFIIKADTLVNAIGQERESDFGLKLDPQNFMMEDGIFAGGDFLTGAGNAVSAIAKGARAAEEIDKYVAQDFSPATIGRSEDLRYTVNSYFPAPRASLSVDFCGVKFKNPFILAAAPPTDELEMLKNGLKAGWGGAVLKTTSTLATQVPLKYPMMSGINFESQKLMALGNIDLISEHHIDRVEERVRILKNEFPDRIIVGSIMGSKKEDWEELVARLSDAGADMIECSFSCPQGSLGAEPGKMLAQSPALSKTVAGWVKSAARRHKRNLPVVIKITPHVTDICEIARAVKEGGADAVCASNTIQSLMGIDIEDFVPYPKVEGKSTYSGMSGPAIRPMTLKVISEIAKKVGIPITGTGGPVSWRDAIEFMLCGATTVQFCTAVMHYGYDIIEDITGGVAGYLDRKKFKNISEIIGKSLPFITSHEELSYRKKVVSKIDQEKCIRCDLCYIDCRDGGHMAIGLDKERRPIVDEEKCVGCGLCALICPVNDCIAIKKK